MELFSEIYGLYYRITADILQKAPLTRQEVQQAAQTEGFEESVLYLIPKLLDRGGWRLLEEKDGKFASRLEHPVRVPVSLLELRWLKSVIQDPRSRLFLADGEISRLKSLLSDVCPLFDAADFLSFDQYRDGDPYDSPTYLAHFRKVLCALRSQNVLKITFRSGAGHGFRICTGTFLPLKLEYSEKNDKFRVYCRKIHPGQARTYVTINLGRILKTEPSSETFQTSSSSIEDWFASTRSREPVIVDISPERNSVERFLLEFSAYEKQSEFDSQTGMCRVRLWYPLADETEILIRILGFGPTVKVLGPEEFVEQIRKRVARQSKLLSLEAALSEKRDPNA